MKFSAKQNKDSTISLQSKSSAFTLLGLVIVVFIISVISFTVIPHLAGGIDSKTRLERDASRIKAIMERARNLAVSSGDMYILHFNIPQKTYRLTTVSGNALDVSNSNLSQGIHIRDIQTINAEYSDEENVAIRFSPQGWADPAAIHLADSAGSILTIRIDELQGNVTVHKSYWNMRNSPKAGYKNYPFTTQLDKYK